MSLHSRIYPTFKAMGYRNTYLFGVVFEEALILAVLGFIPGLTISIGLYTIVHIDTNLPIAIISTASRVLIIIPIMCIVSGASAASKIQSADPADMF